MFLSFFFVFSPVPLCVSILIQQWLATATKKIATQARENVSFKETSHLA